MFHKTQLAVAIALTAFAATAIAAVSADEAKQLGGDKLTATGSEKAGNKEGTIPPYSGKAPKAPASYNPKEPGQRPDPYNDKPLFSITAKNANEYAGKLDAMVEVFKKYPDYRMDVYPTHRDFAYPKYVIDNTVKNATSCKGANNELKLEGCYGGFPFPIPKTGNQVMWNHLLQFAAPAHTGITNSYVTSPDGKSVLQTTAEMTQQADNYDPASTKPNPSNVIFWKGLQSDIAPARKVGGKLMILDSMDMVDGGRRVYQYVPGQRRVKLAPNLAYDTPSPNSGGVSTMDDAKVFMGALDRYDFKLVGKKEKYIMANNFNLTNHKACTDAKITEFKNFPNPECVRWELHRVWTVEATLKPGVRHIYPKRVFYFDEDVPGAGMAENYDAGGKLYRVMLNITYPFYDHELGGSSDVTIGLDLQTGVWSVQGLSGNPGSGWWPVPRKDDRFFSPEAMAGDGIR